MKTKGGPNEWPGAANVVGLLAAIFLNGSFTPAAAAPQRVLVSMDTSAWTHRQGFLAFRVITRTPSCEDLEMGIPPGIRFVSISHDGFVGPLRTSGCSGMRGNLAFDPRHPAEWTVPRVGEHGFSINLADREFKPDEAWIGSFIRFEVELPTDDLDPKEELSIAFRNREGEVGFGTGDRSGQNALLRLTADPSGGRWKIWAFEPAKLRRSRDRSSPDTVVVRFPKPSTLAGPVVKPRRVLPRLIGATRNLEGKLWVEYTVPSPGGTVRVQVLDEDAKEVFRHEYVVTTPGVYGVEWPESRRDPPPTPGQYRVLVEIAGHRMEAECEL